MNTSKLARYKNGIFILPIIYKTTTLIKLNRGVSKKVVWLNLEPTGSTYNGSLPNSLNV